MEISLETVVGWMGQLDPAGTIVDPCDTSQQSIQVRELLDGLNESMQKFLSDAGYVSTEKGWVKDASPQ